MDEAAIKRLFFEVIEEEFSPQPVEISPRWYGGSLVLRPANDTQEKDIPIETFLKKILTVRDSLRVLEQKLNTSKSLTLEEKSSFQAYITKAYGSLTTFNVLFKDGKDRFHGSGAKGGGGGGQKKDDQMSLTDAKKKLGLNEY